MKIKKRIKFIILVITLILIVILTNVHVEWLWYSQFNFESILLKKILIQLFSLVTALLISITYIYWHNKWLVIVDVKESSNIVDKISGSRYSFLLTASIVCSLKSFNLTI